MRYRREILEVGGSRPAMESFKAFRGREPNIDALLRHNGMTPDAVHCAPTEGVAGVRSGVLSSGTLSSNHDKAVPA